jgi:hypothetical protein
MECWNSGMVEYWVLKQNIPFLSQKFLCGSIFFHLTHHSNNPSFHYSNRTTLSFDSEALEGRLSTGCE